MLMKNERFFCEGCHKYFDEAKFYYEKHGQDSPPYEKIAVCPICNGDNFLVFNTSVEKIDIAEKLLPAIKNFNLYIENLKNIFGDNIKNNVLFDGIEIVVELISELYDFLGVDMQRKILKMTDDKEMYKVLMYLKGEI